MDNAHLGLNVSRLIAGFGGGLLYAFAIKEKNPAAVVISVVAGGIGANYLSDIVAHYAPMWIPAPSIAFGTGLCAMALCQGIIHAVKIRLRFVKDEIE